MFVTCYIVVCVYIYKKIKKTAFRPQTTTCAPEPKDATLAVEQTWRHKSKASPLRGGFLSGIAATMATVIYDLFTGSTNHDEALNPLSSAPIPVSLGHRRGGGERTSGGGGDKTKKKGEPLNALQHMNIAIINSALRLGPSVSLNGPIGVNHCCLQASLGTH